MNSTELTFAALEKALSEHNYGNRNNPVLPRLSALAKFLNANYVAHVVATCERSWTNTDRQIPNSRLRSPGKGRSGNKLTVTANRRLRLNGFSFLMDSRTFNAGEQIFSHDSSETYRHNREAVEKAVSLLRQLQRKIERPEGRGIRP